MTFFQLTPAADADLEAIRNHTERMRGIKQAHHSIEGLADSFGVMTQHFLHRSGC